MHAVLKNIRRTIINKEVIEDLQNSGLTVQDALDVGWFEVHSAQELREIGFQTSINKADIVQSTRARLIIPYKDENNREIFYRLKLYPPITGTKYLQPVGVSPEPYILPQIWNLKSKNTKPLIITEGEKKVLCLFKNGFYPIGLPGVWSWCKEGQLNQTLAEWNWNGRTAYICFDNDRLTNSNVLQAEISLAINLAMRGAKVHIVEIPKSHKKMGVDDFIVKFSVEDFEELISQAKSIYNAYPKDLERDIQKALIKATENQRFNPERIETVVESFAEHFGWKRLKVKELLKKLIKKEKEPTLLEQASIIIYQNISEFFQDTHEDYYAVLKNGEYYKTNSKKFRRLAHKFVQSELHKPVSEDTVKNANKSIEAQMEGVAEKRELFLRVGMFEDDSYYDLGNFNAVRISKGSWEIVKTPPIFEKYPHQKVQVEPSQNADIFDIYKIFNFVNLQDEDTRLLFLTYLLFSFIPDLPHPILMLFGEQGSGKSTAQVVLRELIDPSEVSLLTFKSFDDFYTTAIQNWFLPYDNLSYISQQLSDEFSKISTGAGITKRELYSDANLVFYKYKRALCLSGINLVGTYPDLLDRSIVVKLDRWSLSERKTEAELKAELEKAKPLILGAVFSILASVWGKVEKIPYPLPRMADYSLWSYHFAEILDYSGVKFLEAYNKNHANSTSEIITSEPLANLVISFVEKNQHFQGTPQSFLKKLKEIAEETDIDEKELPKNASWLVRKLNVLKTNLYELGIAINEEHNGKEKILQVYKTDKSSAPIREDKDDIPF